MTVLSYAFWQRRFGGDPQIVNKTIILDGKPYQVIGVMPADLKLPQTAELWVPMNFDADPEMKMRQAHFFRPVGRLKAGVSLAQAQADTDSIAAQLEQQFPDSNTAGVLVWFRCVNNWSATVARLSLFFSARSAWCC